MSDCGHRLIGHCAILHSYRLDSRVAVRANCEQPPSVLSEQNLLKGEKENKTMRNRDRLVLILTLLVGAYGC
jgi:hypothetical protein